jgi:2-amino-4-hydroxy-6-hydroxymethyldihydropteridine diphosphokinase
MKVSGWEERYKEILKEFNYNRKKDSEAARFLNSILKTSFPIKKLEQKIKGKTVFVIGAGPSLTSSIGSIKKFSNVTKIVADGATKALLKSRITPDVVVTDLDSNIKFLKKASGMNVIMVVHAHGDNIEKLPMASNFKNCLGTTEGKPFDKIRNFGGFTDGDRCVFLAMHFGAKRIILFGMDFGNKVGKYSKEGKYDRHTKLKKLRRGKMLLEWIAPKGDSELYTTSKPIKGFHKIRFSELQELVRT